MWITDRHKETDKDTQRQTETDRDRQRQTEATKKTKEDKKRNREQNKKKTILIVFQFSQVLIIERQHRTRNTKTDNKNKTTKQKQTKGKNFYKDNKDIIDLVEAEFDIEKELLLALMGIETNFGTYVGKMDIISSLATLSYDQRRSEFFTKELITLLKLIENKKIDYQTLYGSWAGAFGFFQFMPSTITNYAIDYNKDEMINLKDNKDAYPSAANYLNQIGWKKNEPCFYRIELKNNIPKKYLNISAKKLHNKKKLGFFKKYIKDSSKLNDVDDNVNTAIITPDKDIIPGA